MCGLAGIYNIDKSPVSKDILLKMTAILSHRGPDHGAVWQGSYYGLGHRRLKIIDLSDNGNQPMANEDGKIWLVCNGEIYNFVELRNSLVAMGHRFKSKSDSEIIIHAYEAWGIECLSRFDGMFSLVLIDTNKNTLFMARDRLGIKPLFYFLDERQLLFASEIKAILMNPSFEPQIDSRSLDTFLAFNYVAAPHTMFKGIKQLLPGEYLLMENGSVKKEIYWRLSFNTDESMTQEKCDKRCAEIFYSTVKSMMSCDVPYGAFLSGGLDSSSIVYAMNKIKGAKIKTFSIDFSEKTYSEISFSRHVSKFLDVEHVSRKVHCPDPSLLEKLVWFSEEPTADASLIPMYYLSELASSHVKMALSGDGADELMGGYETYLATTAGSLYQRLPLFLRKNIIAPLVNNYPVSLAKGSVDYKLKTFIRGAQLPDIERHYYWRTIFDDQQKELIYTDGLRKNLNNFRAFDAVEPYFKESRGPLLNRLMEVDTRFYLPNDMLVKVDRASMAHGLEVRVPFLAHKFTEFMATVPPRLKFNWRMQGKFPLRRIMKSHLPGKIVYQAKKGFNVPIGKWLLGPLNDFTHDILSEQRIKASGLFEPREVSKLMADHEQGKADNGYRIYGLLFFMLWKEKFLDKNYYKNENLIN